jgi:uncharacterized small protein (DUF1192 family)
VTDTDKIEHASIALFPAWDELPANLRDQIRDRLAHVLYWGQRIAVLEAEVAMLRADAGRADQEEKAGETGSEA